MNNYFLLLRFKIVALVGDLKFILLLSIRCLLLRLIWFLVLLGDTLVTTMGIWPSFFYYTDCARSDFARKHGKNFCSGEVLKIGDNVKDLVPGNVAP